MIQSKKDYVFYKAADRIISGKSNNSFLDNCKKKFILPDYIGHFMYLLRTVEYYKNCRHDYIGKFIGYLFYRRFLKISVKLGFSIPLNVFGPALYIPHYGTIVVNPNTKVGAHCVLHTCVCIAGSDKKIIGDNAYISTGVIITGNIKIPDNVSISSNSLVNKSFNSEDLLIGGTPAIILKERQAWYIEDGKEFQNRILEINKIRDIIFR